MEVDPLINVFHMQLHGNFIAMYFLISFLSTSFCLLIAIGQLHNHLIALISKQFKLRYLPKELYFKCRIAFESTWVHLHFLSRSTKSNVFHKSEFLVNSNIFFGPGCGKNGMHGMLVAACTLEL